MKTQIVQRLNESHYCPNMLRNHLDLSCEHKQTEREHEQTGKASYEK